MPVFTSEDFRFLTPADPQRVWQELTRTGEPAAHLYGLAIQTDWEPQMEDVLDSADQQEPGISDVHSASSQTASDGTAYNTW